DAVDDEDRDGGEHGSSLWLDIDECRHHCHWWREVVGRTITAMTGFLLLLGCLVLAATCGALVRRRRGSVPSSAARNRLRRPFGSSGVVDRDAVRIDAELAVLRGRAPHH